MLFSQVKIRREEKRNLRFTRSQNRFTRFALLEVCCNSLRSTKRFLLMFGVSWVCLVLGHSALAILPTDLSGIAHVVTNTMLILTNHFPWLTETKFFSDSLFFILGKKWVLWFFNFTIMQFLCALLAQNIRPSFTDIWQGGSGGLVQFHLFTLLHELRNCPDFRVLRFSYLFLIKLCNLRSLLCFG